MSRALLQKTILDRAGNVQAGVTVHVYEPGTTTPIAAAMHDALTGGSVLSNPLTTDANGGVVAFLDAGQDVTLLVVEGVVQRTVPALAGAAGGGIGGSEILGPAMPLTIAAGVLNVATAIAASCHYVIVDGEGSADDYLDEITNGGSAIPDGYFLVMESASPTITLDNGGTNIRLANRERGTGLKLGDFVDQVYCVYSDAMGKWVMTADQSQNSILSENGRTEIIARDNPGTGQLKGLVNTAEAFLVNETSFEHQVAVFFGEQGAFGVQGIYQPMTAPSAPALGWAVYTDTADGKLKAKHSTGTTITLATP